MTYNFYTIDGIYQVCSYYQNIIRSIQIYGIKLVLDVLYIPSYLEVSNCSVDNCTVKNVKLQSFVELKIKLMVHLDFQNM